MLLQTLQKNLSNKTLEKSLRDEGFYTEYCISSSFPTIFPIFKRKLIEVRRYLCFAVCMVLLIKKKKSISVLHIIV